MSDKSTITTDEDLDRFKERKEEAKGEDITPLVEFWTDDKGPAAFVFCQRINRDDALDAMWFGASGFNADAVVLCLDSHYTQQPINPATGKQWGPGEMQKACDEDGACSTGIITDCLVVMEQHRDGTHRQAILPYHVDKESGKVHWHDPERIDPTNIFEPGAMVDGLVIDACRAAFERPKGVNLPSPEGTALEVACNRFGLEEWQAELSIRVVTAKMLLGTDRFAVALGFDSEEHAEYAMRSMEDGPDLPNIDQVVRKANAENN